VASMVYRMVVRCGVTLMCCRKGKRQEVETNPTRQFVPALTDTFYSTRASHLPGSWTETSLRRDIFPLPGNRLHRGGG
jgi:hypothetical protein